MIILLSLIPPFLEWRKATKQGTHAAAPKAAEAAARRPTVARTPQSSKTTDRSASYSPADGALGRRAVLGHRLRRRPRLLAEVAPPLRFENSTAPISTTSAHAGDRRTGTSSLRRLMIAGSTSSDTRFITLISGLSAGPGGVLERVADRVADHGRLVGLGALAALVAVLDVLLGVVPRATGVAQEVGHELTGEDHAGEERAEGVGS